MSGPVVQPPQAAARRHGRNGHPPVLRHRASGAHARRITRREGRLEPALAFGGTVWRYLTTVLPSVSRELRHWRSQALKIPDPVLRSLALESLSKRGNIEGAALFAVLAPRAHRRETVRALVAFQTAYNYLDTLAEQPAPDPVANGRQLHLALLVSLDPAASHPDYYALHPQREDDGFLAALVDTCRSAFIMLPSNAAASAAAWAAAARIVAFQSLNLTEPQGGHEALERWAHRQTPNGSGLDWWQTAAAGGSSLAVHALIAMAGNPNVAPEEIAAIQDAYFPWICALHSLLDSLVDVAEDALAGQHNLLAYHANAGQAAFAMKMLARRATAGASALPDGARHRVILIAMATYYLSSPEGFAPDAHATAKAVADVVGPLLAPARVLFAARRLAGRHADGGYR